MTFILAMLPFRLTFLFFCKVVFINDRILIVNHIFKFSSFFFLSS